MATTSGCGQDDDVFGGDPGSSSSGGSGAAGANTASSGGQGQGGNGGNGVGGGSAVCVDLGDPCTSCQLSACNELYCDCYGDPSCTGLFQCATGCSPNDLDCLQKCWSQYPNAISDAALVSHCAATSCAVACPTAVELEPCQECLYTNCQPEMNQCVSKASCTLLLYCVDGCGNDPTCLNDCYTMYSDALVEGSSVATCAQNHCAASCG